MSPNFRPSREGIPSELKEYINYMNYFYSITGHSTMPSQGLTNNSSDYRVHGEAKKHEPN